MGLAALGCLCTVSWQPLAWGNWWEDILHIWTFLPPQPPWQAGSGEGVNCYWIVLLVFWHLTVQASHTSCVCHLVIPNPRMSWAVWSYTAAALHHPLTCFLFVPWLLWWERGDLGRLTATRALLSSVEVLTGCIFWKGGVYVPAADWRHAKELPRDLQYSNFYSCWR